MKRAVNKKKSRINAYRNQTGGGPPTKEKLSDLDEIIIDICTTEAKEGDLKLKEIGFEDARGHSMCFYISYLFHTIDFSLFIITFKGDNNHFNSSSISSDSNFMQFPTNPAGKDNTSDDNDFSYYTPKKSTPTSSANGMLPPSARKILHQSQIDRAHATQEETNQLLRQIIDQNNKLIAQNQEIVYAFNHFFAFFKHSQSHDSM